MVGSAGEGYGSRMPKLPTALQPLVHILKDALAGWSRHGTERLAASLSFYTLFSMAPMLMVVTAVFGWFLGEAAVQEQLSGWLTEMVGPDTSTTILELVENADRPGAQAMTAVIGMVTIVLAATRTFDQFQGALNTIWESPPPGSKGVVGALSRKALSFGLVVSIGLFVLVSVAVGASLQGFAQYLSDEYGFPSGLAVFAHDVTNLLVLTVAFGSVYRLLPARKEAWSNVIIGGLCTGILFSLGKHGIAMYLGRSSAGSAYGASGSIVVLLLWMYYSAMIVLGGAELTQAIARYRNGPTDGQAPAPAAPDSAASSEAEAEPALAVD